MPMFVHLQSLIELDLSHRETQTQQVKSRDREWGPVRVHKAYRFGCFGWGRANSVADIGVGTATIGHGAAIKLLVAPIAAAPLLLVYGWWWWWAPVAYSLLGPKWFSTADNITRYENLSSSIISHTFTNFNRNFTKSFHSIDYQFSLVHSNCLSSGSPRLCVLFFLFSLRLVSSLFIHMH